MWDLGKEGTQSFFGKVGGRRGPGAAWGWQSRVQLSGEWQRSSSTAGAMCGKGGSGVAQGRTSVPIPRALCSRAGLHATLRSRTATVSYGQSFELFCQVDASYTLQDVPASVRWLFQPSPATGPLQELVQVSPTGTVVWRTAQPHFQGKAQLAKTDTSFKLHVHSALPANQGSYQCEVQVWRRNILPLGQPAANASSNAVGIKVVLPGKQTLQQRCLLQL